MMLDIKVYRLVKVLQEQFQ